MNRFNKPVFNGISTKHERKNKEKMLELFHKPVKSGIKKNPYGWAWNWEGTKQENNQFNAPYYSMTELVNFISTQK